ncbi:MAG TPA: type II toxin-antitoxin system VapC family toxin [Pyrinomonadaceae bacterium]|nr:type II toxin-antitoxin system VapC family toxin [Pyrinomonadaceae bacterium]
MADCFIDSSALVKAYIAEIGTDWVRAILNDPHYRISISALAEVEVTSALTRRFNKGDLTQIELDQACDELGQDCATYSSVDITSQIVRVAVAKVRNRALRAYDAVQLASAITMRNTLLITQGNLIDFTLVSADNALNDAARLEGVQVQDPNTH